MLINSLIPILSQSVNILIDILFKWFILLLITVGYTIFIFGIRKSVEELGYRESSDKPLIYRLFRLYRIYFVLLMPLLLYLQFFTGSENSNDYGIFYYLLILSISFITCFRISANISYPFCKKYLHNHDFKEKNKEKALGFLHDFLIAAYFLLIVNSVISIIKSPPSETINITIVANIDVINLFLFFLLFTFLGILTGEIILGKIKPH